MTATTTTRGLRLEYGGTEYVIRPDDQCWILATIQTRSDKSRNAGEEYEADIIYPGRFDQALQRLLDRMLRDHIAPDQTLTEVVATVATLYATIREACN